MHTSSSPEPIATVAQFKGALLAVRDKKMPAGHLKMFRAQCLSPNSTITATKLAEAAEYSSYNAANLQYGKLASNMADFLGFTPETRSDGTPLWWTTLSYSPDNSAEPVTGHFQFVMRPELVTALREMHWV